MKFRSLTITVFFVLVSLLFAQENKQKFNAAFDNLDDSITELEENKLTLRFFNAVNGETLDEGKVLIEGIGEYITDLQGRVQFSVPKKDGTYGVRFSKNGFITTKFTIEIDGGTMFYNNRFSISPVMDLKYLRVVTDWGKKPKDLDAHMVKEHGYHISYQDKHVSADGYGVLDRDDRDSYGPETITIKKVDKNGVYHFYIHDYSDRHKKRSTNLSNSKVSVKVYGNGKLLHVYNIMPGNEGVYWHVFDIIRGEIVPVNSIRKNL